MLREYQIIREFADSDEFGEEIWMKKWLDKDSVISKACLHTIEALYYRIGPSQNYKNIDPELYDIVNDELRLDCPDFVLIFAFWRKLERAGVS